MAELRQPWGLKEIFGRLRSLLVLQEDSSSEDAGEERLVEGRDGALKVFLAGEGGEQLNVAESDLREIRELLTETNQWLEIIAYHLASIHEEPHLVPGDME